MAINEEIRNEKLQYNVNREEAELSALSSGKKLINMNILQVKKQCILIEQIIEQAKFAYSPLGKALGKQTGKQVGALKSVDVSNKKDELKQSKSKFPLNLKNNLVLPKFKEIVNLQLKNN